METAVGQEFRPCTIRTLPLIAGRRMTGYMDCKTIIGTLTGRVSQELGRCEKVEIAVYKSSGKEARGSHVWVRPRQDIHRVIRMLTNGRGNVNV